jgi:segregation and condensation protein B
VRPAPLADEAAAGGDTDAASDSIERPTDESVERHVDLEGSDGIAPRAGFAAIFAEVRAQTGASNSGQTPGAAERGSRDENGAAAGGPGTAAKGSGDAAGESGGGELVDVSRPAGALTAVGGTESTDGSAGAVTPADGAGEGSGVPVQPELDELADPDRLRSAVEAVLLVVDTPTSSVLLAQVLGRAVPEVENALRTLRDEYDAGGRGLDLREVADGWRLYSRDEYAGYVERFILEGQQARLTQAALETVAVIAYRQPVTRSRISAIRGVSVDAVMRTLLTRGLVEECGADPDTGGGLYRTTTLFLEKMGLRSLDELPSLAPLLPDTSQLDDVELST